MGDVVLTIGIVGEVFEERAELRTVCRWLGRGGGDRGYVVLVGNIRAGYVLAGETCRNVMVGCALMAYGCWELRLWRGLVSAARRLDD